MGLEKLYNKFHEETLKEHFTGLFCRDHPKNTRFCINFFTSIGLGALTEELREYFTNAQKMVQDSQQLANEQSESESESSSSSSDSDSDTSSSDSRNSSESKSSSKSSSHSRNKKNNLKSSIKDPRDSRETKDLKTVKRKK